MSKVPEAVVQTAKEFDPSQPRRRKLSLLSFSLLIASIALAATGQMLLKTGINRANAAATESGASVVVKAVTSPFIILGLMVFAVSAVTWLATLRVVPLSIAYPFNALQFIAILVASSIILNEKTNVWTWVGTLIVVSGLILVVTTKPGS